MDVRITGRPDETQVAAVLAVLRRCEPPSPEPSPLAAWREQRRAAVRRTQQTR